MQFMAYISLFAVALVAATLFPAQSEALLAAMLVSERYSTVALIAVATAGNTMGASFNWWIGGEVERFKDRRWFPLTPAALDRVRAGYLRWGRWSLLFSWLPVIGDAITVAAGLMREPLVSFVLLAGAGKLARYLFVWLAVTGLSPGTG
jgi:membrane protein YqaA with SNARE-associated domain